MKSSRQITNEIKDEGIIPTIRASAPLGAVRAAESIHLGGIAVLELCMAMPNAVECLAAVAHAHGANMVIGAGTVTNVKTVQRAWDAGAQFIVTPGFSAETIAAAKDCGIAIYAGALTPTEVQNAAALEPDAVKLYPCNAVGGPRYVKAIRGQYPEVELIASGGVTLENLTDYFHAGACAVGVGAEIADEESIVTGNQRLFVQRARRFRKIVDEAQARWGTKRTA